MIKAICFDLDGVYFTEAGKKGFERNLTELSGKAEDVKFFLTKSVEMSKFVRGQLDEHDFWNYARSLLGITLTDIELRELWVKEYEINQQVRDYVLKVKSKGYKTCICSNNNPARIPALEEKFRFLNDFDVKVLSYEVGETKPSKVIYEALLKAAAVEPSELVYSDDNPDRIQGARELGINVFVYENFDQFKAELTQLGLS